MGGIVIVVQYAENICLEKIVIKRYLTFLSKEITVVCSMLLLLWIHACSASVGISVCCSDLVSGIFTFPEKENITWNNVSSKWLLSSTHPFPHPFPYMPILPSFGGEQSYANCWKRVRNSNLEKLQAWAWNILSNLIYYNLINIQSNLQHCSIYLSIFSCPAYQSCFHQSLMQKCGYPNQMLCFN